MAIHLGNPLDDARPAVALVILHAGIEPQLAAALTAGLPSCSDLPLLQLEDVAALHEDWTAHGPQSRVAGWLSRLGSDCLLLVVEPAGSSELEWLGSVAGQRLVQFTATTQGAATELIARLQRLRRERLLAVLPL